MSCQKITRNQYFFNQTFDDLSSCNGSVLSSESEIEDWASGSAAGSSVHHHSECSSNGSESTSNVIVVSVAEAVHELNKHNKLERVAASVSGLRDKILPGRVWGSTAKPADAAES